MKQFSRSKYMTVVVIMLVATLLSVFSMSSQTVSNVPFCIHAAGCHFGIEPKGQITDRQYGYPLSYKKTSTFIPEHNDEKDPKYAGFAEANVEQQKLNLVNVGINIIFWSALLSTLVRLLPVKKTVDA